MKPLLTRENDYGSISLRFTPDKGTKYTIKANGMTSFGGYSPGGSISNTLNEPKYGPEGHWQNRYDEMSRYALVNSILKMKPSIDRKETCQFYQV